jgi:GGDEF domain-containing protein
MYSYNQIARDGLWYMDRSVFIDIEDLFVKKILIKAIADKSMGIIDSSGLLDMEIKLQTVGDRVFLAIVEVFDKNLNEIEERNKIFRKYCPSIPVLALVYKHTSDIVGFVMSLGFEDILLLPENTELYNGLIENKLNSYLTQMAEIKLPEFIRGNNEIKENLKLELSRAARGAYSLSFVMAHLTGAISEEDLLKSYVGKIKSFLRNTDKLYLMDDSTFIVVFPFAKKESIPSLEDKFREAYKLEKPKIGIHKKLCIFSATYPDDGENLDILLERLEKGINNSMVINSVHSPFNSLSRAEIENYKKMIKQYRRFF